MGEDNGKFTNTYLEIYMYRYGGKVNSPLQINFV